ncbi:amino acid permease [Mariniblastus sp.]|nr:amino acid permease [Mariniblastus sp.]MDB4380338.1 amino acid permease [Mariniblastus sp.]
MSVLLGISFVNDKLNNSKSGFGMFGGVFTPCTLTILGVIMFLRFGYVVGHAGILETLVIIGAATLITLLTTLSLSAIVTNTEVKGGGAYFLISRSLGAEFGGAIGLVFFVAQAISVAMYVIGFSEAVVASVLPGQSKLLIATICNIFVFGCVFRGAGWTIRLQYFILAILLASLGSFYAGAIPEFDSEVFDENWGNRFSADSQESIFTMFALFFPAVTGIMAGANMSGDLRDPSKAIPTGTLLSIVFTGAIYFSLALLMGGAREASVLSNYGGDSMVIAEISAVPFLITAGVFAATLSSALGSMMGAPRILQAFAKDDVFENLRPFAAGSGEANEPRRATILTFIISQAAILLVADLNTIAPLITMFFMLTYGLLNLATFYEAITKNPSYRPRFRYSHWLTSLAGAVGCLLVMFLISWIWALVAIFGMACVYLYISQKEVETRWGDLHRGLLFERTRKNLLKLEKELHHPKNWRPIILAFSGASWERPQLAVYGHWFTAGHGVLTLGYVIQGDVENRLERLQSQERILNAFIQEQKLEAFPAVVAAPTISAGMESLVQTHGLGALRPNTVLLGWPNNEEKIVPFSTTLRSIHALERSVIAMRFNEPALELDPRTVPLGTIDVWWRGNQNGELMLLLAHLLAQNQRWRSRPIRLLRMIENEAGRDEVLNHLEGLIDNARIVATPHVVVSENAVAAIQATSRSAAIVFMGMAIPEEGEGEEFHKRMTDLAGELSRVVFVKSAGGMSIHS